ncbi:MAG: TerB family tellurite resistance protein [Alphaproteobacteria bacterium]
MSIWGKIVGGTAGLALGGALGAIIGVATGHAVDMAVDAYRKKSGASDTDGTKQIAFTTAVVVLGAKLAKVDGTVTRDEVNAFKEVFRVPDDEMRGVAIIFNQAKKDSLGFEPYARQVGQMFAGNSVVLEELLFCLFHIAKADGHYNPKEKDFLREVAGHLGFDEPTFKRIEAESLGPQAGDPYTILGVARSATNEQIKAAWRKLIREHHPDTLVAQGLPQEFIAKANETMATINAAYEIIQKERGFN